MRYRIIHHLKSKDEFLVNNVYGLQRILRSVINREQDTIFVVTMNEDGVLINIHLLPLKSVSHYLHWLFKLYRLFKDDKASKMSIAHNFSFKSDSSEKSFTNELLQLSKMEQTCTILQCNAGNYKILYQRENKLI